MVFMLKKTSDNVSKKDKGSSFFQRAFGKEYLVYTLIMVCDIVLVIYCACQNKVQYVKMFGKDIFVGKSRDMFFGKNYINIIIIIFFSIYLLAIRKGLFHKKVTKKSLLITFCGFFLINLILFYIFTKRVY